MRKGITRLAVLASVTAAAYPLAAVADRQASAELWIQHDLVRWRQLKKSPAYYD